MHILTVRSVGKFVGSITDHLSCPKHVVVVLRSINGLGLEMVVVKDVCLVFTNIGKFCDGFFQGQDVPGQKAERAGYCFVELSVGIHHGSGRKSKFKFAASEERIYIVKGNNLVFAVDEGIDTVSKADGHLCQAAGCHRLVKDHGHARFVCRSLYSRKGKNGGGRVVFEVVGIESAGDVLNGVVLVGNGVSATASTAEGFLLIDETDAPVGLNGHGAVC